MSEIKVGGSYTCKQCGKWSDGSDVHICQPKPATPLADVEEDKNSVNEEQPPLPDRARSLLPTQESGCPFCGCRLIKATLFAIPTDGSGNKLFEYRCPKCKAQVVLTAKTEAEANAAWNTRSSDASTRAVDCVCGCNGNVHREDTETGAARECTRCDCEQFYNVHMALKVAQADASKECVPLEKVLQIVRGGFPPDAHRYTDQVLAEIQSLSQHSPQNQESENVDQQNT